MSVFKGVTAGITATFLWAFLPTLCKIALSGTNINQFLLLRYIVAFSTLFYLTRRTFRKFNQIPLWIWCAIFFTITTHNLTQALCLKEIPVSWYIIFFSCAPILTYMLLPGSKNKGFYACFLLAIYGTYVFLNPEDIVQLQSKMGLVFLFVSIMSWVIITRLIIYFQKVYNDFEIAYILNTCNLIGAVTLFLLSGSDLNLNWKVSLIPIIFIGIMSPLAVLLFSLSLRILPKFGIASQYLELVFGVIIGFIFFNEIPSNQQFLGSGLIITALLGTTLLKNKSQN
ncbi:MAG: DMT family transporter [Sphingobacteriia bacterium]|nr:DMT family transporter [Sphingobacteriia bacterium]